MSESTKEVKKEFIYEIKHVLPTRRGIRLKSIDIPRTIRLADKRLNSGCNVFLTEDEAISESPSIVRYAAKGVVQIYRQMDGDIVSPPELVSGDMLTAMWQERQDVQVKARGRRGSVQVPTEVTTPKSDKKASEPPEEEEKRTEKDVDEVIENVEKVTESMEEARKEDEEPTEDELMASPPEEAAKEGEGVPTPTFKEEDLKAAPPEEEPTKEESKKELPKIPKKKELKNAKKADVVAIAEAHGIEIGDKTKKEIIEDLMEIK